MHFKTSLPDRTFQPAALLLSLLYIPASFADTPESLAEAMDVPTNSLGSATFTTLANSEAAKTRSGWGVSLPFVGPNFFVLSNGKAADQDDPGYITPASGTAFSNTATNPVASQTTCGGAVTESANVFDYTEMQLVLNVPTNAAGFKLKFNFFTAEYPESVCSQYNDRFMIRLTALGQNGNIAFDSLTNPVSVNTATFPVTSGGELVGTGMDGGVGAAIGWQTLQTAVFSGETITLKFSISDGTDPTGDSVAVIDAFEWIPGTNPPPVVTVPATIYHAVEIGWASELGKNYQVEWISDVNSNIWNNLGLQVAGTVTNNSVFDSTRYATNRFYRVRQVP